MPGCQCCHLRLNATVQGLGTTSSETSTALMHDPVSACSSSKIRSGAVKIRIKVQRDTWPAMPKSDESFAPVIGFRGVSPVRGSLRTNIRAELSSNGSESGVAVSPRTKIRAELLSNGEQLALPPLGWRFRLGSEPGDGDLSPCSPRFIRLAPLRCVPIFLGYVAFFILLGTGLFSRYWQCGRIVATRYGCIDATTATQLLTNTTWFSLPRDIGTPRHRNPESKHRDIGTSGHWNPECTGRGKGTDPRTGKGH